MPVDNCVPEHPLITAIQVPVQGIEVECNYTTRAGRHIHDGCTADEILFTPRLTADDERRAITVTPLQYDAAHIYRAIETR